MVAIIEGKLERKTYRGRFKETIHGRSNWDCGSSKLQQNEEDGNVEEVLRKPVCSHSPMQGLKTAEKRDCTAVHYKLDLVLHLL